MLCNNPALSTSSDYGFACVLVFVVQLLVFLANELMYLLA